MARLRAFADHRFVGTRDDMRYYDCDDPSQFAALSERVERDLLVEAKELQSFSPDVPAEARNRGFRAP
jgi:hypothetical protein